MAQSNFTAKLAKDLRRNPKKTAVLALLLLVAIWFWVPLVWKWVAPESSDSEAADAAASNPQQTVSQSPSGNAGGEASIAPPPAVDWRTLTTLLEQHQALTNGQLSNELHDPFARPKVEQQEAIAEETEEVAPEVALVPAAPPTPAQLGLLLRSTATGGDVRLARINGELCRVGTVLVVPSGTEMVEYEITDIVPDRVTFQSDGETYELERLSSQTTMQISQAGGGSTSVGASNRIIMNELRRD